VDPADSGAAWGGAGWPSSTAVGPGMRITPAGGVVSPPGSIPRVSIRAPPKRSTAPAAGTHAIERRILPPGSRRHLCSDGGNDALNQREPAE
jgi:hypothetical protein